MPPLLRNALAVLELVLVGKNTELPRCNAKCWIRGCHWGMLIESSIAFWGYPQPNAIKAPAKRCVQRESLVLGNALPLYKDLGDNAALSCTGARLMTQRPSRSGVHMGVHHARAFHAVLCVASRSSPTCGLGSH
jgi:hypothetical protein